MEQNKQLYFTALLAGLK